ncbi:MAG: hypothetical protein M3Y77_11745 [Actinomycetota bacterium]|nr:hypothetical protein [Actinomycetota bacterium]
MSTPAEGDGPLAAPAPRPDAGGKDACPLPVLGGAAAERDWVDEDREDRGVLELSADDVAALDCSLTMAIVA